MRAGFTISEKPASAGRLTRIFFPLFENQISPKTNFFSGLKLEIADTPGKRIRGLSGRDNLDKNAGLLFIYDQPEVYGIWMKDMNFPIDVIWLDEDYRVVDIAQDVRSDSFPTIFEPSKPALYILEVNTGFVIQNQIKIGDRLEL